MLHISRKTDGDNIAIVDSLAVSCQVTKTFNEHKEGIEVQEVLPIQSLVMRDMTDLLLLPLLATQQGQRHHCLCHARTAAQHKNLVTKDL